MMTLDIPTIAELALDIDGTSGGAGTGAATETA